jgi:hypothetical protein
MCKAETEQNEFIDQCIFQKWTENFIFIAGRQKKSSTNQKNLCSIPVTWLTP